MTIKKNNKLHTKSYWLRLNNTDGEFITFKRIYEKRRVCNE